MTTKYWMFSLTALVLFAAVGCEQEANAPANVDAQAAVDGEHDEHEHGGEKHLASAEGGGHSHMGWWCTEHGVPEEVCRELCSSKVAAEFQKKGDWCEEHNRPDSQCFIHHPELKEKFAAQYEAKFGEKPPEPKG